MDSKNGKCHVDRGPKTTLEETLASQLTNDRSQNVDFCRTPALVGRFMLSTAFSNRLSLLYPTTASLATRSPRWVERKMTMYMLDASEDSDIQISIQI